MAAINDMLAVLNILDIEGHTKDSLMQPIDRYIYIENVKNLLDMMMAATKQLEFHQIENEDVSDDPNGIYDPNYPTMDIIATYNIIDTNCQVVVIFDKDTELADIDIGFDIIFDTILLCNRDAVLHALFLYVWYKFEKKYNLEKTRLICV